MVAVAETPAPVTGLRSSAMPLTSSLSREATEDSSKTHQAVDDALTTGIRSAVLKNSGEKVHGHDAENDPRISRISQSTTDDLESPHDDDHGSSPDSESICGPSAWDSLCRATPPPPPPRRQVNNALNPAGNDVFRSLRQADDNTQQPKPQAKVPGLAATSSDKTINDPQKDDANANGAPPSTSSVSSPHSRDADDEHDVDALLEGIDRVRIDDLWSTPRSTRSTDRTPNGSALKPSPHFDINSHSRHEPFRPNAPGALDNARQFSASALDAGNSHQDRFRAGLFAPPMLEGAIASIPIRSGSMTSSHDHAGEFPSTSQGIGSAMGGRSVSLGNALGSDLQGLAWPAALSARSGTDASSSNDGSGGSAESSLATSPHEAFSSVAPAVASNAMFAKAPTPHSAGIKPAASNGLAESRPCAHGPAQPSGAGTAAKPQDHGENFPGLFKVFPCPTPDVCAASGNQAECFYYHDPAQDRRRGNFAMYKPHMCRFIEEVGGCRKGDRCPFSHNDFERRYHPDRFGKETCRDFLRGDCPRRYCTFRHEVSDKVETAICQIDAMNDKELLQLVLKISDAKGRALSEKLLRRFGHGKKHSGWRLEGFNPNGRDDQKVKFVSARVDVLKKLLRNAGERKWSTSLKTTSLRDMMSGVRKVAEEVRERHREDQLRGEAGPEMQRLIRSVFSSTNWSCHSQEGDNPFLVTPENQNDAITSLERLIEIVLALSNGTQAARPPATAAPASSDSARTDNGLNMRTRSMGAVAQLSFAPLPVSSSMAASASESAHEPRLQPVPTGDAHVAAPASNAGLPMMPPNMYLSAQQPPRDGAPWPGVAGATAAPMNYQHIAQLSLGHRSASMPAPRRPQDPSAWTAPGGH